MLTIFNTMSLHIGTVRGNTGSIGNNSELMYEIKVLKSDYENAKYLINESCEQEYWGL